MAESADLANKMVFVPLGGVGEIGMNLGMYGYGPEGDRRWIVIDFGISFPGPHLPGVDVVFADIAFLEEERLNVEAILITHAHEDHYGALLELWEAVEVPLYATAFTAGLLGAKAAGFREYEPIPVNIVEQGDILNLGSFQIEWIPVSHSIPEPNALLIKTDAGTVLHTGDWKLDPEPGIGKATDTERLKAIGEAGGVDTLVCDSTNAMRDGDSPSEKEIAANLAEIIKSRKNRVAVTTFSSNLARIKAIAKAAQLANRELVVIGRAMHRVIDVARELGYWEGMPNVLDMDEYGYLPRDNVVLLLTGSQGEPRAALSRIARDDHPHIALTKGDTVIFSSRAIPGNEKEVGGVINSLVRSGIDVITDQDAVVHVTGHPRRNELRQMYEWVKPKSLLPVHGEAMHLRAHARLAMEAGINDVMVIENGDMINVGAGPLQKVDEVPVGELYRDGDIIRDEVGAGVPERRKLSYVGIVSVAIAMNRKGEMVGEPAVDLRGVPEEDDDGELFANIVYDTILDTFRTLPAKKRKDYLVVREAMYRAIRAAFRDGWGKKPVCTVFIMPV